MQLLPVSLCGLAWRKMQGGCEWRVHRWSGWAVCGLAWAQHAGYSEPMWASLSNLVWALVALPLCGLAWKPLAWAWPVKLARVLLVAAGRGTRCPGVVAIVWAGVGTAGVGTAVDGTKRPLCTSIFNL